jgi:hypothetical protein
MRYFTYSLLLLINLNITAQTPGVKVGLNLSTIVGERTSLLKPRSDIHLGLLYEFKISDTFSFQPELIYSSQGATQLKEKEIDAISYKSVFIYNYLNLPLLTKYYLTNKINFEVGPQLGVLLSAKHKYDVVDGGGYQDKRTFDIKSVKDVCLGISFGMSYLITKKFFLNTRYNRELFTHYDGDKGNGDSLLNVLQINSVLQFSVGYLF